MMEWYSEGKKLSQTSSDSAADLKVDETKESLPTSRGDVKDRTFAMQSSGRLQNSTPPLSSPSTPIIIIIIDNNNYNIIIIDNNVLHYAFRINDNPCFSVSWFLL